VNFRQAASATSLFILGSCFKSHSLQKITMFKRHTTWATKGLPAPLALVESKNVILPALHKSPRRITEKKDEVDKFGKKRFMLLHNLQKNGFEIAYKEHTKAPTFRSLYERTSSIKLSMKNPEYMDGEQATKCELLIPRQMHYSEIVKFK
ncbi:hypothetical protein L9F63_005833, partial [Diploptera punctata]